MLKSFKSGLLLLYILVMTPLCAMDVKKSGIQSRENGAFHGMSSRKRTSSKTIAPKEGQTPSASPMSQSKEGQTESAQNDSNADDNQLSKEEKKKRANQKKREARKKKRAANQTPSASPQSESPSLSSRTESRSLSSKSNTPAISSRTVSPSFSSQRQTPSVSPYGHSPSSSSSILTPSSASQSHSTTPLPYSKESKKGAEESVTHDQSHRVNQVSPTDLTKDSKRTPLMDAVIANDINRVIAYVVNSEESINNVDSDGNSALIHAMRHGSFSIIALLLGHNAAIDHQNNDGQTALMRVAEIGEITTLEFMLQKGADINKQSKDGSTALMYAVRNNPMMIMSLLKYQADPTIKNFNGKTACSIAFENKLNNTIPDAYENQPKKEACTFYDYCIKELLKAELKSPKCELNLNNYWDENLKVTLLMYATASGDDEWIDLILAKNSSNINAEDVDSYTALTYASRYPKIRCLQKLLQAGANVNHLNKNGYSPLMYVIQKENKECFDLLLNAGANVNAQNKTAQTPLILATKCETADYTAELIKVGAIINTQDDQGGTALMFAAGFGNLACLRLLLEANADINMQDNEGWSALMYAVSKSNHEIIEELLRHNANRFLRAKADKDAFTLACDLNDPRSMELLCKNTKGLDIETLENILDEANLISKHQDDPKILKFVEKNPKFSKLIEHNQQIIEIVETAIEHVNNAYAALPIPNYSIVSLKYKALIVKAREYVAKIENDAKIDHDTASQGKSITNRDSIKMDRLLSNNRLSVIKKLNYIRKNILALAQNNNITALQNIFDCTGKRKLVALAKRMTDGDKNTALHLAAHNGHAQIVTFLLDLGFNPCALNGERKTPRTRAHENNHKNVEKILLDAENNYKKECERANKIYMQIEQALQRQEEKDAAKIQKAEERHSLQLQRDQEEHAHKMHEKQQQENAEEQLLNQKRQAQAKREDELRDYFSAAVLEDDDASWLETISQKYRVPGHGKEIDGIYFTHHALERMSPDTPEVRSQLEARALRKGLTRGTTAFNTYVQPRGITPEQVIETITLGELITTHRGAVIYRRNGIKVVVAQDDGTIITTFWE